MINMDEINDEIKRLEECEYTTYGTCQKLALLYIVRDHYKPEQKVKKNHDAGMPAMMQPMTPAPASLR